MSNGKRCGMCQGTALVYGSPCPECGDKPWHARIGGYTNHACRCAACVLTWNRYRKRYLKRWRGERKRAGLTARGTQRKPRKRKT